MTPRLLERYRTEVVPKLSQGVRVQERPPGAAPREGRGEHGRRRGDAEREADREGGRGARRDHRPEGGDPQGAQVDRELQAAPGPGDRLHGDAARHAHVGVLRPARERGAAARARLQGVSPKAFDGRGNYTLGIREQIIFPEIDYDKVEKITGLNVTVCTTRPQRRRGQGAARRTSACRSARSQDRTTDHDDRSDRRHADAHPQRGSGAPRATSCPSSKLKLAIAGVLQRRGLPRLGEGRGRATASASLVLGIRYDDGRPAADRRDPAASRKPGPPRLRRQGRPPARAQRARHGRALDVARRALRPRGARAERSAASCSARSGSRCRASVSKPVAIPSGVTVDKVDGRRCA